MRFPEEFYEEILAHRPSSDTLFLVLSHFLREGQCERVIQECLKALTNAPQDIRIRQLLAEAYYHSGRFAGAEAELEKVTEGITDLMDAFKLQAKVYRQLRRPEEAKRAITLYLSHQVDDREALELRRELESLTEAGDQGPSIIREEALALAKEEVHTEVKREAKEIAEEVEGEGLPDISTPTLAEVYFHQGQIQEAIETYEKVVSQNPKDERSRSRLRELQAMMRPTPAPEIENKRKAKSKTERLISLLDTWRGNLRDISPSPQTP